jgi:glycosyltransferase involved in cell wall biosynthesis
VSGGVYRPLSFAQHAAESGWDVIVVSSGLPRHTGPGGDELRRRLSPDIPVHELAIASPPLSTRLTPRIDGGLFRAIEMVRQVEVLDLATPDVILGTGPSFQIFLAAHFLSRRTGARLVLDYRDEWTECPFSFVRTGRLDRWWERRCLGSSDLAIYTTEAMRRHAVTVFGPAIARTAVVPNGVDREVHPVPTNRTAVPPGRARVAFVGTVFSHPLPGGFLRTLQAVLQRRPDLVDRLEVCWAGWQDPPMQRELERFPHQNVLGTIPSLPQSEARGLMGTAAALLLFGGKDWARYRPGKLYEYLASHRPVVVYGGGGEIAAVIESLQAGIVVNEGDEGRLEEVLDGVVTGKLAVHETAAVDRWLDDYDRRRIAAALFTHLNTLLADAGPAQAGIRRRSQTDRRATSPTHANTK